MVTHADTGGLRDGDQTITACLIYADIQSVTELLHQSQITTAGAVTEQDIKAPARAAMEEGIKLSDGFNLCSWQMQTGCNFTDRLIRDIVEPLLMRMQDVQ